MAVATGMVSKYFSRISVTLEEKHKNVTPATQRLAGASRS